MEIIPQLDLSTYSSQLFWFFFSFIVLYFISSRVVIPRVEFWIKERSLHIKRNIEFADEALKFSEYQIKKCNDTIAQHSQVSLRSIEKLSKNTDQILSSVKNIASDELRIVKALSSEKIGQIKNDSHRQLIDFSVEISLLYYSKLFDSEFNDRRKLLQIAEILYSRMSKKKVV